MIRQNWQTTVQRTAAIAGEDGVVLLSVLVLLAVVSVVGATSITTTLMNLRVSGYYGKSVVLFYVAEAGVNRGWQELSDDDGIRDFTSIATTTTIFQGVLLNGGSYTVVATPLEGKVPPQLTLKSTACYPAADPCPETHARSVIEVLLESNPEASESRDSVRMVAWKEVY